MAKYGELWDDSALVKALDDAISKYKIMHVKGGENDLLNDERIAKGTEESAPIIVNGSNEVKSAYMETDDKTPDVANNTTHTKEAMDSSVAEKYSSEVITPSNGARVNTESAEAYNLLLEQYNAVEEQRQKLLAQFAQYGNWDYQGYGYGYDSQYHHVPASQPSGPPICSCRPYVCPYSTAPCTSMAAVSSCETCVGSTASAHNGNSVSLEDGFIKTAMGAVDRAIHSFNTQTSGIPDVDKEGKKVQVEMGSQNMAQEKTSQTDLSVVLNAWFSAGFYTGKYLSEQRKPAVSISSASTDSNFKDISKGN